MIDGFHFINHHLLAPAVGIGLLVLLVFIWKEWTTHTKGFILNIFLAVVAITSLLMVFLKPAVTTENFSKGVLLTNAYDNGQLDSLKRVYPKLRVVEYNKKNELQEQLDSTAHLFILGEGVPNYDFWQLKDKSVTYVKNEVPSGIIRLQYTQKLKDGDELVVRGLYSRPKKGAVLSLEGPGAQELDSLELLKNDTVQYFEFSANTKAHGNFLFQLTEKDSLGQEISKEPLPVVVEKMENLKILIVNDFPSFETKYLKNFLADVGHQVVVRSQITKGKYKFEYFNTARRPLYNFSKENLEGYDLVVLDAPSYFKLKNTLDKVLEKTHNEDRFGIFVQPDERLLRASSFFDDIVLRRVGVTKLSLPGFPKLKLEKYPYQFSDNASISGLAIENHTFFEYQERGLLGTTVLKNTYQLVLDGELTAYRALWSEIINRFQNKKQLSAAFKSPQLFAFLNEPYFIDVQTDIKEPLVKHSAGYSVPLRQDISNTNLWKTKTYPSQLGWNAIRLNHDSTLQYTYFVMDSSHWKSLKSFQIRADNLRQYNNKGAAVKSFSLKPIAVFWFFSAFLLAMGFLWLLPKLNS